jgi:hypothetical protein
VIPARQSLRKTLLRKNHPESLTFPGGRTHRHSWTLKPARRTLTGSSPPHGSDESETFIRRLRMRRFQQKSSNHSDVAKSFAVYVLFMRSGSHRLVWIRKESCFSFSASDCSGLPAVRRRLRGRQALPQRQRPCHRQLPLQRYRRHREPNARVLKTASRPNAVIRPAASPGRKKSPVISCARRYVTDRLTAERAVAAA